MSFADKWLHDPHRVMDAALGIGQAPAPREEPNDNTSLLERIKYIEDHLGIQPPAPKPEPATSAPSLLAAARAYLQWAGIWVESKQKCDLQDAVNAEPARIAEREAAVRALIGAAEGEANHFAGDLNQPNCAVRLRAAIARVEATS